MLIWRSILSLGLAATTLALAFGFAGALHPAFDSFSHFRLHLAVVLLILAALWSFRCSRMPSIVFALIGFGALFASIPGLASPGGVIPSAAQRYRLLHFNVYYSNPDPAAAIAAILATRSDIVMLSEYAGRFRRQSEALQAAYPYQWTCNIAPRHGGVAIFSRFPLDETTSYCHDYAAAGLIDTEIEGVRVRLGAVHLRWPWPASGPGQVRALEPTLRDIGPDALVAGDFNAATWSDTVRRFAAYGGLAVQGGIGPTWLSADLPRALLPWIGLPIDNVMSKGRIRILRAATIGDAGSDHLPVQVDFEIVR